MGDQDMENEGGIKFGWIKGVLMRCILNIWGEYLKEMKQMFLCTAYPYQFIIFIRCYAISALELGRRSSRHNRRSHSHLNYDGRHHNYSAFNVGYQYEWRC